MAYVDKLDNFQSVLNATLGDYSDTTTMGNSKRYQKPDDLAIAADDTAKIWITMNTSHPKPTQQGYSRRFIIDIIGLTSEALENVVYEIENLIANYTQVNSTDPYAISGHIINTVYLDGETYYNQSMDITAKWAWD